MGSRRRKQSALGDLIALIFLPLVWLMRLVVARQRGRPDEIKRFYRSAEWKRLRFAQLQAEPCCRMCGASAASGARMNVDHVRPLHRYWHLRLDARNLQTLCAGCNWGKEGRELRG
jgi:5-methylcytosine-specific restriction endonuclease McrA